MLVVASSLLVLAAAPPSPQSAPQRLQALVVSGANNHDWKWTSPEIGRTLTETGRFDVEITYEPEKDLATVAERAGKGEIDVIVLDYNRGERWPDRDAPVW